MAVRVGWEQTLAAVHDDVLRMSSLVQAALERDFEAFREHNFDLAQLAISEDNAIDELQSRIEDEITAALSQAAFSPEHTRTLLSDLLICEQLETIGDSAENIARAVLRKENIPSGALPAELIDMAARTRQMLHSMVDAYARSEPTAARAIAAADHEIDRLYRKLFERCLAEMSSGTLSPTWGTYLLSTGQELERIGDRITAICERIIYATTGSRADLND